jgi:hypothetical protein
MITVTPQQLQCQTTDIVTGWINGFHFWGGAGNLSSQTLPKSVGNNTVILDKKIYPWRKINALPTAYSDFRSCFGGDAPWALHDRTSVGMMAKSIKKGVPEGYTQAVKMAGFFLPPTVGESDHSILQPEPIWITHVTNGDVRHLLNSSCCQQGGY